MGADGVGAYIFEHAQRHTASPGHLLRPFESGDFHRKGAARRQRAEDGKRLTRGRLTFDPLAVGIELGPIAGINQHGPYRGWSRVTLCGG